MFARRLSERFFVCTLLIGICVGGAAAQAADKLDPAKLKKGDKLEVNVGGKWVKATFVEPFSSQLIKVKREDFSLPTGEFLENVRLPARRVVKGAGPEENPFATEEERIAARKSRTWSDKSGKFKVEAKLLRVDGDNVVIKRADDKELAVPLARLSDADQEYVRSFVPGDIPESSADEEAQDSPDAPAAREIELTETNLGAARLITPSGGAWTYKPDATPGERRLRDVRIPLNNIEFMASVTDILLLPGQGRAFVVTDHGRGREHKIDVQAIDLQRGLVTGQGHFSKEVTPIDISADGKWILARSPTFGAGSSAELRLYQRDGMRATPKYAWVPYAHHGPSREFAGQTYYTWDSDVDWAAFVDSHHLVTLSHAGELVLWEIEGLKPVYQAKVDSWGRPALSAGKKYLALTVPAGIALLNIIDGSSAGLLPQEAHRGPSALAFSPDGRKLAWRTHQGRLRVWDLESQKLESEFAVTGDAAPANDLAWLDDRFLTDGVGVVDIKHYCTVWSDSRRLHREPAAEYGDQLWKVERPAQGALLTSRVIPPQSVRDQWDKIPADAALVLRPGMEVAVEVRPTDSYASEAREKIVESLTKRGMRVVPQAELKLVATIELGDNKTMNYRTIGGRSFDHTVTQVNVQEYVGVVSYERGGETLWTHRMRGGAPWHVPLKEGESIQQAAQNKANMDSRIFANAWIPVTVGNGLKVSGTAQAP